MKPVRPESKEIFCEIGYAIHMSQALENFIAFLFAYMSYRNIIDMPFEEARDVINGVKKNTLGALFGKMQHHFEMPDEWIASLDDAVEARNRLAHRYTFKGMGYYFEEPNDIPKKYCAEVLQEVLQMQGTMNEALLILRRMQSDIMVRERDIIRGIKSQYKQITGEELTDLGDDFLIRQGLPECEPINSVENAFEVAAFKKAVRVIGERAPEYLKTRVF